MSQSNNNRLDRIELLVEANAKAIEAMRIELRDGISDAILMLTQMTEESAQEREAIRQRQAESDQRFETMLAEARADRAEMRAVNERNRLEHAEFRQAMERNRLEHEEFRQAIRALLDRT